MILLWGKTKSMEVLKNLTFFFILTLVTELTR